MIEMTIENVVRGQRTKIGFLRIASMSQKHHRDLRVELWDRDPRNVEPANPPTKMASNAFEGALDEPLNTGLHRFGWLMLTIALAFNSLRPEQSLSKGDAR